MCGRFTLRTPAYKLAEAFGVEVHANLAARYNVAPSQDVAALRTGPDDQRELVMLRWGLVPGWAKDPAMGNRMINARAETVAEKPAFRAAFRQRRCLIPADGFYEWQKTPDGSKQPYLIARPDGEPFVMAGLWEHWAPAGEEPLETCAIITTEANDTLAPIHHRMPVIVTPGDHDAWLDPAPPSAEALTALLRPAPDDTLAALAVDRHVNNARHDDPACIEPATSGLLL
ncbi:MAG: SOS response-associated peptidase [Alphaproteobacteria bacterium]